MKKEKDLRQELNEISPGFPEPGSHHPPSGYFDSFPGQVLNQWKSEGSQHITRTISWKKKLTIAATIAALGIGAWFLLSNPGAEPSQAISSMEAYQYIHEHIDEFEDLLENTEVTIDENLIDIPAEEAEEYLLEEIEETNAEDLF